MKMTRVTSCLFVLVLSLLALAFAAGVPTAHAASPTTFEFKSQGLSATASFDNLSPDGCIDTFADVDASQSTAHNQTFSSAFVFIGVANVCTNTPLLEASGFTTTADFQIDPKLLSASLNTTISVTDALTNNTFNVSVSMAWTSTSAIAHEDQTFHLHTKAFTENSHFNAAFRDANASGTVSDGTTNYTPSPAFFAQTMSAKEIDVLITHP